MEALSAWFKTSDRVKEASAEEDEESPSPSPRGSDTTSSYYTPRDSVEDVESPRSDDGSSTGKSRYHTGAKPSTPKASPTKLAANNAKAKTGGAASSDLHQGYFAPGGGVVRVRLELRGSEQSFGLLLSDSMRVIAVDEHTPAARSGLKPLDLVMACDGARTSANLIGEHIRGKSSIELSIDRPPNEDLWCACKLRSSCRLSRASPHQLTPARASPCPRLNLSCAVCLPFALVGYSAVAAQEAVDEWTLWEVAVTACAAGDEVSVMQAVEAFPKAGISLGRRISQQEAAAFGHTHCIRVRKGQTLSHIAATYGLTELAKRLGPKSPLSFPEAAANDDDDSDDPANDDDDGDDQAVDDDAARQSRQWRRELAAANDDVEPLEGPMLEGDDWRASLAEAVAELDEVNQAAELDAIVSAMPPQSPLREASLRWSGQSRSSSRGRSSSSDESPTIPTTQIL